MYHLREIHISFCQFCINIFIYLFILFMNKKLNRTLHILDLSLNVYDLFPFLTGTMVFDLFCDF